jgi:hypothetical protein
VTLTDRQLNRATLARQLLLRREPLPVEEAVRRVLAIQAQAPPSPYIALWSRIAGFEPDDLDGAFADGRVVKATLMRITLHAVHRDDHDPLHRAMLPSLRAARLHDRRFRDTGMTVADADALVPHVLAHTAQPRSRPEVEAHLAAHLGEPPHEHVWWALRTFAPLVHHATGGPWSFGTSPVFRAAPGDHPRADHLEADHPQRDHEAAVDVLVQRYLAAFGPATTRDVGQFTLLRQPAIRAALERLDGDVIRHEGPDGAVLWDVADGDLPDEDTVAPPRLLPMWDSTLLAYADRRRIIPDQHRTHVIRRNGDVLPTVLVDGYVRGVWRATADGIEVTAFEPLDGDAWAGLAEEATDLAAMLAPRDPQVYGRYGHWWQKLPPGERRTLTGRSR